MCPAAAWTWQSHLAGSGWQQPLHLQSPLSNPENCTALSLCCLSSCVFTGDVNKTVNGTVRVGQGKFGETCQLLNEVAPKHPLPGVPKPASLGAHSQLEHVPFCTAWVLASARGLCFILHRKTGMQNLHKPIWQTQQAERELPCPCLPHQAAGSLG